jgi:hypothetical protein
MYVRAFEDEEENQEASGSPEELEQPEYDFEGFEIQFSKKIMLTPVGTRKAIT